jgi:hypothetical protein
MSVVVSVRGHKKGLSYVCGECVNGPKMDLSYVRCVYKRS